MMTGEITQSSAAGTSFYVLDDRCRPQPASRDEWDKFRKSGLHIVGRYRLPGGIEIVTEFLGTDQDGETLGGTARWQQPYLFGTSVIDPSDMENGEEPWFYQDWQEAADGHRQTVEHYCRQRGIAPPRPAAS